MKHLQVRLRRAAAALIVCSFAAASCEACAQVSKQMQVSPSAPFGSQVFVFNPQMSNEVMQGVINRVYAEQQHAEFGAGRYAFLFMPGDYELNIPVGFYTQVVGLGASPDVVRIHGNVHADAALKNNNATTTFWRGAEGFSVFPAGGTMQWAVSQAVFFRRMHVHGNMVLHQDHGWASGGWMSDMEVDGNVDSGSQQQWISRNVDWKSWTGANWNMVFVGVTHPPAGEWPKPPYTKVAETPIIREKPFLILDAKGQLGVTIPAVVHNSSGVTWSNGPTAGRFVPLDAFYVAQPNLDTANTINTALAHGKNLIFAPGIFDLDAPVHVTRKNTVVLGLGFATLHPTRGHSCDDFGRRGWSDGFRSAVRCG